MSNYDGVGHSRLAIIAYQLRRYTSTRSRKIVLANVCCIILFLVGIGLAHKHNQKELGVPAENGVHSGKVYYISKRSLCSQSIAHQDLGIQPIAVSKVILRPIIRTEPQEGFDERLEVVEESMVNDVVFLDRNVTGRDAELSATVCPLHSVSILPPRKPARYNPSDLRFGVVINADDVPAALEHWRYWLRESNVNLHLVLPNRDYYRTSEVEQMITSALGVRAKVESIRDIDDFAKLTLLLVQRMHRSAAKGVKWFIVLQPSTFVTSVDDVLLALEPYDSQKTLYMGSISESTRQKEEWGIFAYGGAGIVMSRPLVDTVVPNSMSPPSLA
jgi:hypothetical protein